MFTRLAAVRLFEPYMHRKYHYHACSYQLFFKHLQYELTCIRLCFGLYPLIHRHFDQITGDEHYHWIGLRDFFPETPLWFPTNFPLNQSNDIIIFGWSKHILCPMLWTVPFFACPWRQARDRRHWKPATRAVREDGAETDLRQETQWRDFDALFWWVSWTSSQMDHHVVII